MKTLLILFLAIYSHTPLFAQKDTGASSTPASFIIKRVAVDDKNCTVFMMQCGNDSVKKIVIDKKGNAGFFWGPAKKVQSTSIVEDINTVNKVKNIITSDYINSILSCCAKKNCPDTQCGYFIYITDNGRTDLFAALDKRYATCGSDKLNQLISLLNTLYSRYVTVK